MRLPLTYRLTDHGQDYQTTAMLGDAVRLERHFGMPAAKALGDPIRLECYVWALHSRLSHLGRRNAGADLAHGQVSQGFEDFLKTDLAAIGVGHGDGVVWLGNETYTYALVGAPEGRLSPRPFDAVAAERHFGQASGEMASSAEAHAWIIHHALLREARATGGAVLTFDAFVMGELEGSLEWVEPPDDDADESIVDGMHRFDVVNDGDVDDETGTPLESGASSLGPFGGGGS